MLKILKFSNIKNNEVKKDINGFKKILKKIQNLFYYLICTTKEGKCLQQDPSC